MIIKKHQLKNYLRTGCCIKDKNGKPHVVKDVGGNFVSTNNNEVMQHSAITQITNYHVPTDITTNIAFIGHYVKLFINTTKHHGYWFNGEWARIIGIDQNTYPIRIEYLNKITDNNVKDTVIGKDQIDIYNPFCPEPIVVEEAVIQDNTGTMLTEPINTKPMLQYNHMKKIVDNMMQSFDEPIQVKSFNGQIVKDIFGFENKSQPKITMKDLTDNMDSYVKDLEKSKQKLNFDVLLNSQKIVLDQYN